MRPTWCKLYKISTLHKFDLSRSPEVSYGGDTLFNIENFRNASRVGVLAESLHKYYRSTTSISHKWEDTRIESDRILDSLTRQYLIDKCGVISQQNSDFLCAVYFSAIVDTLNVLFNSKLSIAEQIDAVYKILICENTMNLLYWHGKDEEKENFFKAIHDWLIIMQQSIENHQNNVMLIEIELVLFKGIKFFGHAYINTFNGN
jgi:hypothetical protein